jgi:hypothetical protein
MQLSRIPYKRIVNRGAHGGKPRAQSWKSSTNGIPQRAERITVGKLERRPLSAREIAGRAQE